MRKIFNWLNAALLLMTVILCGCEPDGVRGNEDSDTLFQVSTLNALMLGDYNGLITVEELLKQGDTGLGTFDALEGEMIKADGSVVLPESDVTVPFAAVTCFESDITFPLKTIRNIEALKDILTEKIAENNGNIFYVAKITGDFVNMHVRSVPAQKKPYRPLSEVAESQTEFEYADINGVLVALYCPDYITGINLFGWHIHFISSDGKKGGHVLDVDIETAQVDIDITDAYKLILPDTKVFASLDLGSDLQKDTEMVEGKK